MAVTAAMMAKLRTMGSVSRFVVCLVAFAFALQSYISQTHLHAAPIAFDGIIKINGKTSSTQGKAPFDDGQRDCPLCQAVAHSGVFVASAEPLLYVPVGLARAVMLDFAVRATRRASAHDWQSRAPPQL